MRLFIKISFGCFIKNIGRKPHNMAINLGRYGHHVIKVVEGDKTFYNRFIRMFVEKNSWRKSLH